MSWLLVIFYLILMLISCLSEANHKNNKLSSSIVGTVYCDTCFQRDFSKTIHFISGASVAVECKESKSSKSRFRKEVKTDKHGEFKVDLPFSVSKHVKKIEGCYVKLISSSEPYCAVASAAKSPSVLYLKSRKQGINIFSAGFFTFKPQKQPNLCKEITSMQNLKELSSNKVSLDFIDYDSLASLVQGKFLPYNIPSLPRLPELPPLPKLPPLPSLPGLPRGPKPFRSPFSTRPGFFFPPRPNPFQPPNSVLPPNPLQPPSVVPPNPLQPPSVVPPNPLQSPPPISMNPNPIQPNLPPLIRNPFQPPPAELIPLPSIPVLTQTSPPLPSFTLSIPPFPFPSSNSNSETHPTSEQISP